MTDAQLEWMIRNRKTISPAQRAEARKAWDAKYGSKKAPTRSTAEVSFGAPESSPADLDPVEASATPITPDPLLRKKPSLTSVMQAANTLASLENFDAAFQANGHDYPSAISAFTQQLVERGVEPEYAQRAARARAAEHRAPSTPDVYADEMASTESPDELYPGYRNAPPGGTRDIPFGAMPDADPRTTREERLAQSEQWAAGVDRMKEDYDRATGAPQAAAPQRRAGRYDEAGRPGYDRTFTPREVLAQRGEMESGVTSGAPITETIPGPRLVGGNAVRPPRPIYDEEEATRYQERPFDTNTGKYKPSQKDRDMAERGMVPVLNDDGTVGYSVGYDVEPLQAGMPGAVGRAGRREDLEKAGWGAKTADGPMGPVMVYRPGPDAKKRYEAQADARSRSRIKRSVGISSEEAEGKTTDELRAMARDRRDDDYNARNARWKAQAMLAGGQPTGGPRGTKAATNALLMMNDPTLSEDQRRSLRYMLPGGQLSAAVDAQNMQNANEVIRRFMTSGAAAGLNNPLAQAQGEMASAQAEAERRKLRAPDEDVLGNKYAPSGWFGYDEFTVDEQQQMYDELIAQGYKPAEAQRAVDAQANKRRATERKRWGA